MCRGTSVRKVLVREAKSHPGATVVVGTSKSHHRIRSPVSVAKHCAGNLSSCFSVFAVDNGKVVFKREATGSSSDPYHGFFFFSILYTFNLLVFDTCDLSAAAGCLFYFLYEFDVVVRFVLICVFPLVKQMLIRQITVRIMPGWFISL